jgi:23S rRNA (adenine2503-C2)-methyltransferase
MRGRPRPARGRSGRLHGVAHPSLRAESYHPDMDLTLLEATLSELGQPAYRARQVRHAVLRSAAGSWNEVTSLPAALRTQLAEQLPWSTVKIDHAEHSSDGSVKLRMLTYDGFPLEAVLMRYGKQGGGSRYTACLSSQSGCALACTFCATGRMGLGRSLSRWEILDQFLMLARTRWAVDGRVDNVVMMGMGEPFHNYDEVLAAIRIMNDPEGPGMAARRIAISTVGWIPGIDRLAQEPLQVKLALSLHAPTNELRSELMPVTRRFPVEELMQACRRYRSATRRRVFVEYLLLAGVNDAPQQAHELATLLGRDGFHVNLIAYNPTDSGYVGSDDATVRRFGTILRDAGIDTSYRVSRGRDISAACGQLAAPVAAARRAARARRAAPSAR